MAIRKQVLLSLLLMGLAATHVPAATWFVSNDGADDAAAGTSPDAPLRTIIAAAGRAAPGDTILLRRGDVFRESAAIDAPDVVVDAYGDPSAPRPAIAGSVPITGWQPWRDGIHVADTDGPVGYLYANGALMTIARYPNAGWMRTRDWQELDDRQTAVRSPELAYHPRAAEGYWTGANIRWRHHSWWYETRPIVADDGRGEITLGDRSFERIGPFDWDEKGWGFYIDNELEELDAPGEWFFDPEAQRVYFYPPDGADPGDLLVEGSRLERGLRIGDGVVRNVAFRHQQDVGLEITGRSTVEYCTFTGIGRDATVGERGAGGTALLASGDVRNARVRHNAFTGNHNVAITWNEDGDAGGSSVIERNVLTDTGMTEGYGGSGPWHAAGIIVRGTNVHVRHNVIDGTGYAGVILGTDGNFVEYNLIRNAMATLNDGAGVYTNCSRSTIRHNVILDTRGGMESSGTWATISHGIWPEFLREYHHSVIEGNVCAGSGADGIFLTNNFHCVVRNNVLFGNDRYQLLLTGRGEDESDDATQEHLIADNVLVSTAPGQKLMYFDPRFDYGLLKENVYVGPADDEPFVEGVGWPGTSPRTPHDLAAWQQEFAWADDEPRVAELPAGGVPELFHNASDEVKLVRLDGSFAGLDGEPIEAGAIELPPYSGRVLVRLSE